MYAVLMIIDTPNNLESHVHRLIAAGITTAIRYESRLPGAGWKRWQPDEMKAFHDVGLRCAIVYEDGARQFGYSNGIAAAEFSLERCEARGQIEGAIYYAEDADMSVSDVNGGVVPFFHGVNEVHRKYKSHIRIGCYGSGMVNRVLLACNLIDRLRWITCSTAFNGSRQAIANGEYELWQTHCDTSLLGLDVDYDSARIDDFGQFMPFGPLIVFPPPPAVGLAAFIESPQVAFEGGHGSWYSQFDGIYEWRDTGDEPGSSALGVPDDCQGVSFYDHSTLGKWFEVHAPNGQSLILQQTDIGPAPWTGRKIDIASVSAERFGYSPNSFPTNGQFHWRPSPPPYQVKDLSPRQQAIKWKQIRQDAPRGLLDIDSDTAD